MGEFEPWQIQFDNYQPYIAFHMYIVSNLGEETLPTPSTTNYNHLQIGEIVISSVPLPPHIFLPCDGSSHSINSQSQLYEVIGGIYGENPRDNTFNIPDCRNRALKNVGKDVGKEEEEEEKEVYGGSSMMSIGERNVHSHGHESFCYHAIGPECLTCVNFTENECVDVDNQMPWVLVNGGSSFFCL